MMLQFIQFYVWSLNRLTYGTGKNITNFMWFNVWLYVFYKNK